MLEFSVYKRNSCLSIFFLITQFLKCKCGESSRVKCTTQNSVLSFHWVVKNPGAKFQYSCVLPRLFKSDHEAGNFFMPGHSEFPDLDGVPPLVVDLPPDHRISSCLLPRSRKRESFSNHPCQIEWTWRDLEEKRDTWIVRIIFKRLKTQFPVKIIRAVGHGVLRPR